MPRPSSQADDHADPALYEHLRNLARRIHRERSGPVSLGPTELLHEAWLKLDSSERRAADRKHFIAIAACAMRQILSDHFRAKARLKRGANPVRTTLSGLSTDQPVEYIDVHAALEALAEASPTDADVVVLRALAGLTNAEVAQTLGVSPSTIDRAWRRGRAFLLNRMRVG